MSGQREYFRNKLLTWKEEILKEAKETLAHLQAESENHPDLADRASSETDRAIELRARDRQRKLIAKIDAAIARSMTAPTAIARRPASRSRSSGSKRVRSRRCRSRPRNVTSGANAFIATSDAKLAK
jgi:RNA polymerase-binding protein DksA